MILCLGFIKPRNKAAYPDWPPFDYYQYEWLHRELNSIQFYNRNAIEPLFKKLETAQNKKVTILHIGDSHVQADVFTGALRDIFQKAYGYGGRGMVFPYSTARTHAAVDYTTSHTGRWIYAKNVEQYPELSLGISGVSSKTYDSIASFHFNFRNTILPEFTRIRLYFKQTENSYDLKIKTPIETISVDVFSSDKIGKAPLNHVAPLNYIDIDLKTGQNELSFYIQKTNPSQNEFEIYGVSIENPYNGGVLYHSVGINGAGYYSLLRENLLEEQLKILKPDAIVLDIGANDFWRNGINKEAFTENMNLMLDLFRRYDPKINIIISCSQDIYRGGYSIPDCGIFSQFIKDFSRNNGCAFYDWYWVAGGRNSMSNWRNSTLATKDFIHLSGTGYKLKGELIAEAFYNTANWFKENPTKDSLIFDIDSLANPPIDTTIKPKPEVTYGWIFHKVRKNQTIWTIAKSYGVTGAQIRSWNKLKSNYLWTGQVLKVYTKLNPGENITVTPTTPSPIKPKAPKTTNQYHKVKSGETLSSIARKYNTTVSNIKRLSNITSNTIKIGQVLRVK